MTLTQNITLDALVTLHSSASHIGETVGIDAEFHRVKFMLPDGSAGRVPTITGNSIRGQLRDAAALYLYETLELPPQSLTAFYTLFSGGSLTKSGDNSTLRLDELRALRKLLPMLSLFGAAIGNYILSGKLKCGMLLPLAQETAHLVPWPELCRQPVSELVQTESYTRFDDAKDARKEGYFVRPDADEAKGAPRQMRYQVETLAAGTRLYWHIHLEAVNEMERHAFVSALSVWARYPALGGKSGIGHGLCAIDFPDETRNAWRIRRGEPVDYDLSAYAAFLRENAGPIRDLLHAL